MRDLDTMPLLPTAEFLEQVQSLITPSRYALIGAMVNRQGLPWLMPGGEIDANPDINHHISKAYALKEQYGSFIERCDGIAGAFMLFPKKLWATVGGFCDGIANENGEMIDYDFCMRARRRGAAIGVAKGVYLFHMYRWGSKHPMSDQQHLG